jgi:hypothetical protein
LREKALEVLVIVSQFLLRPRIPIGFVKEDVVQAAHPTNCLQEAAKAVGISQLDLRNGGR